MQAVFDDYEEGDVVWCQDYHLMLLPALLKARYPKMKVYTIVDAKQVTDLEAMRRMADANCQHE